MSGKYLTPKYCLMKNNKLIEIIKNEKLGKILHFSYIIMIINQLNLNFELKY